MKRREAIVNFAKERVREKIKARGEEVDEERLDDYIRSDRGQYLIGTLVAATDKGPTSESTGTEIIPRIPGNILLSRNTVLSIIKMVKL